MRTYVLAIATAALFTFPTSGCSHRWMLRLGLEASTRGPGIAITMMSYRR